MDRSAFELGMLTPPEGLDDTDEVLRLVDEWVQQFEGAGAQWDEAPAQPTPPGRPRGAARSPAVASREEDSPRSIARMRSEWSRLAGGGKHVDPAADPAQVRETKHEPLPLKSAGLLTTFTDASGGSISLSHGDGRLQHRGTVSVRGQPRILEAVCHDIGLPAHVIRAFEFIAAWFGFPFDSVNLHRVEDRIMSWGFWPFAGDGLVRCLHEWKSQAPDAFAACCGTFGIDVAGSDGETPGRTLTVRSESRVVQGRAAEWTIASEPQLLAVLARAGRDAAAQKAQVEVAIASWVTPIMFQAWDPMGDEERLTVDVLKAPNNIACLLYVVRRYGQRATMRLLRAVGERSRSNDEEAWMNGLVRVLRHMKREHDAAEILRIASSPELAAQ